MKVDLRYKGEGYCDKCGQYTFCGRQICPSQRHGKWRFLCELCADAEGIEEHWTLEDEEDLAADRKFHRLRDEGKI